MIYSMTGFGKGQGPLEKGKVITEVRSLNSKSFDLRCRLPNFLKDKEMEIRKLIQSEGRRGKFDLRILLVGAEEEAYRIDPEQFQAYYHQLEELSRNLSFEQGDIASTILTIPNVLVPDEQSLSDREWDAVRKSLESAMQELNDFRRDEGKATSKDLEKHAQNILELLTTIDPHEEDRNSYVRKKLRKQLEDRFSDQEVDRTRYEQEVLYYLDKIDISEEKTRLQQHCKYFLEQLDSDHVENGKKLNFISQEMGREINTLGSKAQNVKIQHIVVQMKEVLEKIKEQVANIL